MGMFDNVVVLDETLCCPECAQVLVRCDHARGWGDLVGERRLWVEAQVTFRVIGLRSIERTSGRRKDLASELRKEGLRVIGDDEPAIAHRELSAARDATTPRRKSRR